MKYKDIWIDICDYMWWSDNARYMKTYMIKIWKHISINIKSILTDICKVPEFRSKKKFQNMNIKFVDFWWKVEFILPGELGVSLAVRFILVILIVLIVNIRLIRLEWLIVNIVNVVFLVFTPCIVFIKDDVIVVHCFGTFVLNYLF